MISVEYQSPLIEPTLRSLWFIDYGNKTQTQLELSAIFGVKFFCSYYYHQNKLPSVWMDWSNMKSNGGLSRTTTFFESLTQCLGWPRTLRRFGKKIPNYDDYRELTESKLLSWTGSEMTGWHTTALVGVILQNNSAQNSCWLLVITRQSPSFSRILLIGNKLRSISLLWWIVPESVNRNMFFIIYGTHSTCYNDQYSTNMWDKTNWSNFECK